MWIKHCHLLIHDYTLVGCLLALHPTIMQHCLVNKTLLHVTPAENLVLKLLLNPALFGMDKEREKAILINTFDASTAITLARWVTLLMCTIGFLWKIHQRNHIAGIRIIHCFTLRY
jgi:hypothetical protein